VQIISGSSRTEHGQIQLTGVSPRRDGRVVDGGGLEKLNGHIVELASFPVKSARHAR
jgi:hypothetical protein